ncbi:MULTISPECIES: hypothetical protein [unclassified Azospirillum]|uniref:hypothetical protein n=1 Tax=unclassified Azospirillum TaxID=2630922 RepID=UPI000B690BC2|nr:MULTISPECIES: hypothetical protein [unclassified Azospirillum]SNT21643.1 hypothetical protein SAMN05880556_13612 [Azospirillum sp. RU38E]SNT33197.1 hypothetical protein SAMN05880591_13612 [Azospirillum sp. RU37A]
MSRTTFSIPQVNPLVPDGDKANDRIEVYIQFIGNTADPQHNIPGQEVPGLAHKVQVDTGSIGIVIPEEILHVDGDKTKDLLPGVTKGPACKIKYEPSNDQIEGNFYKVPSVAIGQNPDGTFVGHTAQITVMGATNMGMDYGMMGIGFDRQGGPSAPGYALDNPYINFVGMSAGDPLVSYTITPTETVIGLNLPDYQLQYGRLLANPTEIKLEPASPKTSGSGLNQKNWLTPQLQISISTLGSPISAAVLTDTGVTVMMMSCTTPDWADNLDGASVSVSANYTTFQMPYNIQFTLTEKDGKYFPVADSSSDAPSEFLPRAVGTATENFVNTGIHPLFTHSYYYNAQNGYVCFGAPTRAKNVT